MGPSLRQAAEPSKLPASDEYRKLWSPNISEVLHRRDIAPRADDAPYGFYIVLPRVGCQHLINPKTAVTKSPPRLSLMAPRRSSPRREPGYSRHDGGPKGAGCGARRESRGKSGNICGLPATPHCGHIPRPFFGFWWEVSVRGYLRQGRIIRDPSGVTRNRLKTIGSDDLQVTVCK